MRFIVEMFGLGDKREAKPTGKKDIGRQRGRGEVKSKW